MIKDLTSIPVDEMNQIGQNLPKVADTKKSSRFYQFASGTAAVTGAILSAPSNALHVAKKVNQEVVKPIVHILGTTASIVKEVSGIGSFQRAEKEFNKENIIWVNNQGRRVDANYKGKLRAGYEKPNIIGRTFRATVEVAVGAVAATVTSVVALKTYSLMTTKEGTFLSGAYNLAGSSLNVTASTLSYLGNVASSGAKLAWNASTWDNITNAPSAIVANVEQTTTSIANNLTYTADMAVRGSFGLVGLVAINTAAQAYLKAADSKGIVEKLGHGLTAVASLGVGVLAGAAAYSPAVLGSVFGEVQVPEML